MRQIACQVLFCIVFFAAVGLAGVTAFGQSAIEQEQAVDGDGVEFFESRIRPLLVANCYECHNSTDAAEGGLAVDWQGAMREGGEAGNVLRSADGTSLLLKVVKHEIAGLEMPEGGKKLSDQQVADLEKWLQMGAPDPRDAPPSAEAVQAATSWPAKLEQRKKWWSFRPVVRPAVPETNGSTWSEHAIDRFVVDAMSRADLQPTSRADRATLARRLYFALIGMPPTAEQIAAFENDRQPDAYERLVDRLLGSEHFGERWARHWMDWVRYADSHGSEGDPEIVGAHHYRDYLIRALNGDVPYDQLVREHIAGDLLDQPRTNPQLGINESIIGSAHWRFVFHGFAPTDALDERVRFTDDAINVFSKAFMGLTVSCARCHDHKFDAISQADYYAAFGVVASARPGRAAIDLPETMLASADKLDQLKRQIRDSLIDNWLQIDSRQITQRLSAEPKQSPEQAKPSTIGHVWQVLSGASDDQFAAKLLQLTEGSQTPAASHDHSTAIADWQFITDQPAWNAYGAGLAKDAEQAAMPRFAPNISPPGSFYIPEDGQTIIQRINPAGVYSNLRSRKLPSRLTSPDFQLDDNYKLFLLVSGDGDAATRYVIQDYPRNGTVFPVKKIDPKAAGGWKWQEYDLTYWNGDSAHIELAHASDGPLLAQPDKRSRFAIRRALVLPASSPRPTVDADEGLRSLLESESFLAAENTDEVADAIREAIHDALTAWRSDSLSDAQAAMLSKCIEEGLLPNTLGDLPATATLVAAYRKEELAVAFPRRIPTLAEHQGQDWPLYDRGNHHKPLDTVPRRFLEAIDATPYNSSLSGRRELAEDILRSDNPLSSRVIVNRIWHHLFGRGIVATADNFGRIGEEPTHPELLDHLAAEFRETDGWHIKKMIRRMVLSKTWQQSSTPADPTATAANDPNNHYWSHMPIRRVEAEAIRDALLLVSGKLDRQQFGPSVSGGAPRRSVYVRARRNALDPFLTTFDSPVPFSTKGRRDATNVPAQSLMLMNSPFVANLAQQLTNATRSLSGNQRIEKIWQAVLARRPSDQEIAAAERFVSEQAESYDSQRRQRQRAESRLAELEDELNNLHSLAAEAWQQQVADDSDTKSEQTTIDLPDAVWKFDVSDSDSDTATAGQLKGSARLESSGLVVDGKGWIESPTLKQPLSEKTLVAEVRLSNLTQRGGGVLTVQTPGGGIFDAVVFGEQRERHWLAGSNNFARTEPFAEANPETDADGWVHLALTYQSIDGGQVRISMFRNGKPYGKPYTKPVQTFSADQWQVLIGLRHGTGATGNRPLQGTVRRAVVYDVALSTEQISQDFGRTAGPTLKQMLAALPAAEQTRASELARQVLSAQETVAALPNAPSADQPWTDLTHSLFNLKEFIYVR
ncbi:MAG: hypothetical protein Aurels2KO_50020 [Aureliella sp.]